MNVRRVSLSSRDDRFVGAIESRAHAHADQQDQHGDEQRRHQRLEAVPGRRLMSDDAVAEQVGVVLERVTEVRKDQRKPGRMFGHLSTFGAGIIVDSPLTFGARGGARATAPS